MNPQIQSKRFAITRMLGQGGMGAVYQAVDNETGANVALKTLLNMNPESLLRFKNEFRLLADIRHPNLVRLGELFCEEDQWFFTMEMIHGQSFMSYVRAPFSPDSASNPQSKRTEPDPHSTPDTIPETMDGTQSMTAAPMPDSADTEATADILLSQQSKDIMPLAPPDALEIGGTAKERADKIIRVDESRLRSCLGQLAAAIHTLHQLGRVHRDIKPSNLLVEPSGRLVLLDYGLTSALGLDGKARDDGGYIVGTPTYMSPEQFQSAQVGPAADWYAFGVLLYAALVGSPPFLGSSNWIAKLKQEVDPPSPRSHLPDLPADLDQLCQGLLRRVPSERPSGSDILRALGVLDSQSTSALKRRLAEARQLIFVGREKELAQLIGVIKEIGDEGSAAVLISGEPGIGKSSLVEQFVASIATLEKPPLVLRGRCYEQESVSFRAFDALIDALTSDLIALSPDILSPLLSYGVQSLANLFPVLYRVPLIAARRLNRKHVSLTADMRTSAFEEFKELLNKLANIAPLVLFIDDLQWADKNSLSLLEYLLTPPGIPGCAVVATIRTLSEGSQATNAALGQITSKFRHIQLGRLSEPDATQLIAQLQQQQKRTHGRDRIERDSLDLIAKEAAGHPLFLSELVYSLSASQEHNLAHLTLADVIRLRIQSLGETARHFMLLVSLVGVPVSYSALLGAANLKGSDEQKNLLSDLLSAQLVQVRRRSQRRMIEPYHDRVRETVLAQPGCEAQELTRLHLAIGRSLLAHTTEETLNEDIFLIINHLGRGAECIEKDQDRLELAKLELRAGRLAKLATTYDVAYDYIKRGLGRLGADPWTKDTELARELFTEQAELEFLLGHPEEGKRCYRDVIARTPTNIAKAELYARKADLEADCTLYQAAMDSVLAGLALFDVRLPHKGSVPAIMREYMAVRWLLGRRSISSLINLPDLTDPAITAVMKLLMASVYPCFYIGGNMFPLVSLRMANLSLKHGITATSAFAFAALAGMMSGAFRKYSDSYEWGELATQVVERFDARHLTGRIWMLRAAGSTGWTRPFPMLDEHFGRAQESCRLYGDTAYETVSIGAEVCVNVSQGESIPATRQRLERWLAVARVANNLEVNRVALTISHWCRVLGTDPDASQPVPLEDRALMEQIHDGKSPMGIFYYSLRAAKLHYLFGQIDEAERLIKKSDEHVETAFSNISTVEHACWHGLIAARAHDKATSIGERLRLRYHVGRWASWLKPCAASCPQNYESHYFLVAGESARLAGQHQRASAFYLKAAESAERNKAPERVALAYELLARHAELLRKPEEAAAYLGKAKSAYAAFGAPAKVAQLAGRAS